MKCSTGTEISVAFVGFQGKCYVFDVKSHPALMREEAGLRSLLADGEVTKVRRNFEVTTKTNFAIDPDLFFDLDPKNKEHFRLGRDLDREN